MRSTLPSHRSGNPTPSPEGHAQTCAAAYSFTFQGQEHDDELNGSAGTSYAFEYRMHDARVGRFLSIDPLNSKYPWNSPYSFSENRVIDGIDLEGLEHLNTTFYVVKKVTLENGDYKFVMSLMEGVGPNPSYEHNVPGADWPGIKQKQWYYYNEQLLDSPHKIDGYIEWVKKEQAITKRNVGEVVEISGDIVEVTGFVFTAVGAPEIGLPLAAAGSEISISGVAIQVQCDLDDKKYSDAAKRVAIELTFGAAGKLAGMGLDEAGMGDATKSAVDGALNAVEKAAESVGEEPED